MAVSHKLQWRLLTLPARSYSQEQDAALVASLEWTDSRHGSDQESAAGGVCRTSNCSETGYLT